MMAHGVWQLVVPGLLTFSPIFLAIAAVPEAPWSPFLALAAALGLAAGLTMILRAVQRQRAEIDRLWKRLERV